MSSWAVTSTLSTVTTGGGAGAGRPRREVMTEFLVAVILVAVTLEAGAALEAPSCPGGRDILISETGHHFRGLELLKKT